MANRGIYPALSGAVAQTRQMEAAASNLANSGSAAFRAQRLSFAEALTRAQGGARPRGDLRYVRAGAPVIDTQAGPLKPTGVPTDLALAGPGLMAVQGPRGERYVRGGAMSRAADGRLLTAQGHALINAADGQPLRLPPGDPSISESGEIYVGGRKVGQLKLVEFDRPGALPAEGAGLFGGTAADPGKPARQTTVLAQHLEGANVSPLRVMTDVMVSARHYEALHRVIEAYREIDTTAARDLASVA